MSADQKNCIAIVDDEPAQRQLLDNALRRAGYDTILCQNGAQAVNAAPQSSLMLLDVRLPDISGLDVLHRVKEEQPSLPIILLTAYIDVRDAVAAIKSGALDYLEKPIDLDELIAAVDDALGATGRPVSGTDEFLLPAGIVAESSAMKRVFDQATRVAASDATVLLLGESGVGKEIVARFIHDHSPRASRPFVRVNCGALPEQLIESELFGHEKGAFTGATARRIGRFEEADGGTLFLDEIGELSAPLQKKLLRFLQEREFQRLEGNQTLKTDVRIISATKYNLEERIKSGDFRDDLYYLLGVITMHLPPLRERKEDIEPLVNHFMSRFSGENDKTIEGIGSEAMDILFKYDYPGNIRELETIIQRAVVLARDSIISKRDLSFRDGLSHTLGHMASPLMSSMKTLECQLIEQALGKAEGNQTRAADILGITERKLRYKMKKYGLKNEFKFS